MSTTPRLTFIGLYNYDSTLFNTLTLPAGIDKMTAVITFLRTYGECPVLYSDPNFIKTMLTYWSVQNQEPIARIYRALSEEYNPLHNFDRHEEYTDTEDTDRTLNMTGTDSTAYTGTNTITQTGTDTLSQTGTNTVKDDSERTIDEDTNTDTTTENTVSAYNSSTYQPDTNQTVDGSITHDMTDVLDATQLLTRNLTDQQTKNLTDLETRNLSDTETKNLQDQETTERELNHTGHLYGNIGVTKSQEMAIDEVELRMKYNIYGVIADMLHRDFCLYLY